MLAETLQSTVNANFCLDTPADTELKVWVQLPQLRVRLLVSVRKNSAQRKSWVYVVCQSDYPVEMVESTYKICVCRKAERVIGPSRLGI